MASVADVAIQRKEYVRESCEKQNRAHPPCICEVGPDDQYCSAQCETMEHTPGLACECRAKVTSAPNSLRVEDAVQIE
jgi:hypothetical protein